jgi:hypothetical protein
MEAAIENLTDPLEKLRAMCREYVDFGIKNANYYNIMFNWAVPKYNDYINTALEPTARAKKSPLPPGRHNWQGIEGVSKANEGFPAVMQAISS